MMTPRERILAVYNGQKPDRVPYMLDLSHYYLHKFQLPWDLCNGYPKPDTGLMDYTKKVGAAFYCPQQTHFWDVELANDVKSFAATNVVDGVPEIVWRFETPLVPSSAFVCGNLLPIPGPSKSGAWKRKKIWKYWPMPCPPAVIPLSPRTMTNGPITSGKMAWCT